MKYIKVDRVDGTVERMPLDTEEQRQKAMAVAAGWGRSVEVWETLAADDASMRTEVLAAVLLDPSLGLVPYHPNR